MSTPRRLETFAAALAAAALVSGSVLAVGTATAATTVVDSTDFQDGTTGSWSQSGGPTLAVESLGKVLEVSGRANDWDGPQLAALALEAGVEYTVTAKVRLDAELGAATTSARFIAHLGDAYDWIGNGTVNAVDWTTLTGTYTPTASGDFQLYLGSDGLGDPASYGYLVDDVTVTSASATLVASDFEDGALGGWTPNGGATLAVVDDRVLRVDGRANTWDTVQRTAALEAGTAYDLSFRVKLADDVAGATSGRFIANLGDAYDWIGNTAGVTAGGWTRVSGSYTPTASGTFALYPELAAIDGLASFGLLLDDLRITTESGGTDPGTDPDVPPGGAVNPTTTPVSLAQGSGDVAALTFDDGPNGDDTAELLDFLAENDIRAVFCVIGQNIQAPGGAELLRRIVAEGHTLCNHSTSYADMGSWATEAVRADLVANLGIIRDALGDPDAPVPFFRAPNGSWGSTPAVAVSLGMQPLAVVNTISDWETQDQTTLTANLRAAIKPGEIVLVHDGGGDRAGSIAAVKTVVAERLAEGWTFTLPVGTPAPGGQVALSTDFEDGLDGWGARDSGSGAPSVEIVTDPVHGGAQAARVSGRTSQGSGIGHDVTGVLETGVTYELSAWLRFADGEAADDVWLSIARTNEGSTAYSTLGQFDGMSNSAWVEVTQSFTMGEAESAYLYFETDYNGTNTSTFFIDDIVVKTPEPAVIQDLEPIKDTVDFPIGVAIDSRETVGAPAELTLKHFDQVTAENYMKPEAWYDDAGNWSPDPEIAALMDFAQQNELKVYGHVLVWHSQTPDFFFDDGAGGDVSAAVLEQRMRDHIFAVAEHLSDEYGLFGSDSNPLYAFDVVNEVVADGGGTPGGLRESAWFRILGEDYIDLAFAFADEAFNEVYADPYADRPVTLFINDYNTEQSGKQQRYLDLVERLQDRGVPIDGVGHQFHVSLSMPVTALDDAIARFEPTGLVQAVTELDVTTGTPVTQAKLVDQGYYYRDAFRGFRARADELFSVTVWGLTDGRSWRNSSGAPLVFDDGLQAKPAYYGIVDGELAAPLRTANVFSADIAAEAGATSAPEWDRLPLIAISADARFQSRWSDGRLTVLVEVDDTSAGGDALAFELDGTTVSLGRDGSGDADGVVAETASGYRAVVELPVASPGEGDTLAFDVRVHDGLSTVAWNAEGETGTLTLLEPLSFVEVVEASSAPAIDGAVDAGWDEAGVVTTSKHVQGSGAEATVRTLWKGATLYVLAIVDDPVVDVSGSDPWVQDSVELYVDAGNYKNGSYRYDDTQIRISAENAVSFGTGDEAFQAARLESATALIDGGYVVEAAIGLLEEGGLGSFHGLDFQVNDAAGGARSGISNWADPSGAGYQSTARWGVGELVGPAEPGTEEPGDATVTLGASTVRAGGSLDVALGGFEPGTVVELVLQAPPQAAGGAGGAPGTARVLAAAPLPATLATLTVGPDGTASGSVTIPRDTAAGSYRLAATVDGAVLASGQLTVLAALASTGADLSAPLAAALLLVLGGVLAISRARRRGAQPRA